MNVFIDDARRDIPGGPISAVHIRRGSWWPVHKVVGDVKRPGSRFVAVRTASYPEALVAVVGGQLCTFDGDTETRNLDEMADCR